MHPITEELSRKLVPLSNKEIAASAKAYLKNQFEFLGIRMQERRKVCNAFLKEIGIIEGEELVVAVKDLWQQPEREFQYCAIELMAFNKKVWEESIINLFEYCIVNKSWWDTVDFNCTECVSPYFKKFPNDIKAVTRNWNTSDNIWLQRSSLLSQKGFKKDTDTQLLAEHITNLSSSKEFFVQKAIGWMLRDHARIDADWVRAFVANNTLAPLSKREALKHIGKED